MWRATHQATRWRQQWSRTQHEAGKAGSTADGSDGLHHTRHVVGDTGGAVGTRDQNRRVECRTIRRQRLRQNQGHVPR
eukprot:3480899-Prymnesium_polylepis.1